MKITLEKRWSRWLAALLLAAALCALDWKFSVAQYSVMRLGMALAAGSLVAALMVRIELKGRWTISISLLFTAFCGVFLLYIAINGAPLQPLAFLNNLCLLLALLLMLLTIAGDLKAASLIWLGFCAAFGLLDALVFQFRGNQILLSDVLSIGTALSVAGSYKPALETPMLMLAATGAAALVLTARTRFSFPGFRKIRSRLICLVLAVVSAALPVSQSKNDEPYIWQKMGAKVPGILVEFAMELRTLNVQRPEGYSTEGAEELASAYAETETASTGEKPNVVVVMMESMPDLRVLGDFETSREVTPFLDEFLPSTRRGMAISSVFGGNTANSEWEFLTGNTMAFLPEGSVAYRQFVKNRANSLVEVMKNNGYYCAALHPYGADGWDCSRIYPMMGFDETTFIDDAEWGGTVRKYVSDDAFVDKVLATLNSREGAEQPLFLFGISMQNYDGYSESGFEADVQTVGLNGTYRDVNQYLSLMRLTDAALEKLVEGLKQTEEPVVLLVFGDHQPSLQTGFYEEIGNPSEVQLHTVPFLIWKNYEQEAEELPLTSINYLSTLLMESAGLEKPAYYRFLSEAMQVVPCLSGAGIVENGRYLRISDAAGEAAEALRDYEWLHTPTSSTTKWTRRTIPARPSPGTEPGLRQSLAAGFCCRTAKPA